MERLEARGIVAPAAPGQPRTILHLPEPTMRKSQSTTDHPALNAPDELLRVPHSAVCVEEDFNLRTDFGEDLGPSILATGILSPVIGYRQDDTFMLVEGERRLRSLGRLLDAGQLTTDDPRAQVPFLVKPAYADPLLRTKAMLTFGSTGKPLTVSERAHGCVRLQALGLDNTEIAAAVGATPTHVADCLDLFSLVAPEILAAVDAGRCAATMALELARAVPDKAQQLEHFRAGEAAAKEAGHDRVTAKHLPVAIGKAAVKKRAGVQKLGDVAVCRVCNVLASATNEPWPESDLCAPCAATPADGVTEDDSTDHEGKIWKHLTTEVPMPAESKAKVTLLLAFRAERWRYGYEVKWPGVFRPGLKPSQQDGWKKELPNVSGPAADTQEKATLFAAQAARCELEVKDFASGDKPAALAALQAFIEASGGKVGGAVHDGTQAASLCGQADVPSADKPEACLPAQPGRLCSPPPDFALLFTTIEAFKKFYLNAKGIPEAAKFDAGIASLLTFLDIARREREDHGKLHATLLEQRVWIERAREQIDLAGRREEDLARLVAEKDAEIAKPVTSHQSPVTDYELQSALDLLTSVIDAAPGEDDREPHRVETLQVVNDLLLGDLGTPQNARQILTGWITGTLQTYEEAKEAGHE